MQLSVSLSERGPGSLQVYPSALDAVVRRVEARGSKPGLTSLRSGDASASGNFSLLAGNAQSDGGDICFRVGDTTNPLTESNAALSLQAGRGTPGGAVSILGPGGSLNLSSVPETILAIFLYHRVVPRRPSPEPSALVTGSSTAQGTGVIYLNTSCVGSSAGSGSLILASGTTTSNMGGDLALLRAPLRYAPALVLALALAQSQL